MKPSILDQLTDLNRRIKEHAEALTFLERKNAPSHEKIRVAEALSDLEERRNDLEFSFLTQDQD